MANFELHVTYSDGKTKSIECVSKTEARKKYFNLIRHRNVCVVRLTDTATKEMIYERERNHGQT